MSVLIDGVIQVGTESDKEIFKNSMSGITRKLNLQLLESYIKDGKVVSEVIEGGLSSMGSDDKNIKFQFSFNGLKPNIKSLTLNVLSTDDMRIIDKNLNINVATKNERVVQDSEEFLVREVKEDGGNTVVTFVGQEDIIFDTALFIGEVQAKELDMNSKIIDDKGRKVLEKTYKFEGAAKDMNLMFKTLSHRTSINKLIVLYEEK